METDRAIPPEEIRTPRLALLRSTPGRLSALMTGPCEYERVFGHKVEHGCIEWPDVLVFSLDQARQFPQHKEWWLPYLMIHAGHGVLAGVCGYKGPPDADGFVEIGYGIAPGYRGLGLVSEAAAALTAEAFARPGITGVRAHTLPESNASARILTKCGFIRTGDFLDPDEGLLWQWERMKNPTPASET